MQVILLALRMQDTFEMNTWCHSFLYILMQICSSIQRSLDTHAILVTLLILHPLLLTLEAMLLHSHRVYCFLQAFLQLSLPNTQSFRTNNFTYNYILHLGFVHSIVLPSFSLGMYFRVSL